MGVQASKNETEMATTKAETTIVKKQSDPPQGLLYAQLGMDSGDKKYNFRLSQKFTFGKKTSMKLFGSFQDGEDPRCRVQVTHKDYVPKVGIRVNSRLRYDLRKNFIKSSVYIKKKLKIDDTTNLNMKVEAVGKVSEMAEKSNAPSAPEYSGKVELSKTWLNATTTQDCRMRIGADLSSKRLYMQIRENHLMLTCDSVGDWKVLYDF
mmetsp:Transcript_48228/g.92187  ORF Transcript_48228/g.92187 Transcript_48228/m.92187 type:complete len:207 (-) Transcript_48228:468-1088(-)|eukprot:CAMPEP_0114227748 /NCGR_PEP_ID=MMETSP0058-20121206/1959_1 /TAXON_ID=36894 /ORGANISM="Pyramimonas parkeae, CCMP726" /LENGTH=206 /DNA_ID=CAMNT_0001338617 /DNA_START=43 /DNA_END=663 /DNA_ORIENTATION=+